MTSNTSWAEVARTNALFADVPNDAVAAAVRALDVRYLAPDEHVVDEGDDGAADGAADLYLVLDGQLAVTRAVADGAPTTLATLGRGDVFGELAYADAGPRSATVRALGAAVVGRLDRDAVDRLIAAAPRVARALAAAVARRVRAANDARVAALLQEERLTVLGRTAATLVHDLRNPLGVITSTADMIEAGVDDPQTGTARIRRAAGFLLGMVDDLLGFSRGGANYARDPMLVGDVVDDVEVFALAPAGADGRIAVRREVADAALRAATLVGDRRALVRALANLVKNAAEATPAAGVVTFTLSPPPGNDADTGDRTRAVAFTIADTGPGIPDAIRGTLFQPFATYGKSGGNGLGLAMANATIAAHGGTITVATSPAGTCFTIVVPVATQAL